MDRTSVKIGIILLIAWVIPLLGLFMALAGLVMAALAYGQHKNVMARAGIFLNSLGLAMALLNLSVSLFVILSGSIDPFTILELLQ